MAKDINIERTKKNGISVFSCNWPKGQDVNNYLNYLLIAAKIHNNYAGSGSGCAQRVQQHEQMKY